MEFKSSKFRIFVVICGHSCCVYRFRDLNYRRRISRNILNQEFSCNGKHYAGVPVFAHVDEVLHPITGCLGFFSIHESNDILAVIISQRQRQSTINWSVSCYSYRVLGNELSDNIVGIADGLIICQCHTIFVYIVYSIADGASCPMSVNCGVGCNLCIPVKQFGSIRCCKPSVKGITGLARRRFRHSRLVIFLNSLIFRNRLSSIRHKCYGIRRSVPFRIKN